MPCIGSAELVSPCLYSGTRSCVKPTPGNWATRVGSTDLCVGEHKARSFF